MSNKLSGTLTLRLPSGDNRFKAFFNVGESGFATEEYVKQQIAESEKKEEGKYVEKTDIQDTLNSDNSNKPLSANQGRVLKGLLDAKVIEAGAVTMDTEPTEGNVNNVVSSDGLAKEFNKYNTEIVLGGVYDVSAHNNGAVFESLQTLLSSSNLSTLIPISIRHGGMTIRFIQGSEQSSDNKYAQWMYMGTDDAIFTNIANWQSVEEITKLTATIEDKTSEIIKEVIKTEEDYISIQDNNGNEIFHLDEDGLDANNVKSNGKVVLTEHQDISGLATKEEVSEIQGIIQHVSQGSITNDTEEQVYENDEGTETYVKIGSYGIKAKEYLDLNGKPICKADSHVLIYWGDSLTEGNQALDGGSTPKTMQALLGNEWEVINFGRGGDLTNSIACRQGGMNYVVNAGQTIPASGSVTLNITDNIGSDSVGVRVAGVLGNVNASLNPCYIKDVKGKLERVSTKYPLNQAVFTREEYGEAVIIDRPTTVISNGQNYNGNPCIILVGQNGGFDKNNPEDYLAIVKSMVNMSNTDKYIVVGMLHSKGLSGFTWQNACNKLLQAEYGRRYLDVETYMKTPIYNEDVIVSSYAMQDEGLEPTLEDISNIESNLYPKSLMHNDGLHFNKYGYECIAKLEYQRGKELGYW